ncbi:hypothetical protein CPB85DRAFT_1297199 [Mucidula mucida]|nr:hypothetical protein CPB85DRAFT_1297199 [Mucidula mucida]
MSQSHQSSPTRRLLSQKCRRYGPDSFSVELGLSPSNSVELFNGCGYCKWARMNPPQKGVPYSNPGYPGCCRPPTQQESRNIQAADWRAVSKIHQIAIPSEIKAVLDNLSPKTSGGARVKTTPSLDRKNSGGNASPKGSPSAPKSPALPIPAKTRSGGNSGTTSLSSSLSRNTGSNFVAEQRGGGSPVANHSPNRKALDLDGLNTPIKRGTTSKASTPPSKNPTSRSSPPASNLDTRRRSSISSTPRPTAMKLSDQLSRVPSSKKDDDTMSNASGSSGGSGSLSDNTVTSDGGFTDYLSDESEAELQRQAEARAALVAKSQAEELEFRMARARLADVDLRPPKSWDATNLQV